MLHDYDCDGDDVWAKIKYPCDNTSCYECWSLDEENAHPYAILDDDKTHGCDYGYDYEQDEVGPNQVEDPDLTLLSVASFRRYCNECGTIFDYWQNSAYAEAPGLCPDCGTEAEIHHCGKCGGEFLPQEMPKSHSYEAHNYLIFCEACARRNSDRLPGWGSCTYCNCNGDDNRLYPLAASSYKVCVNCISNKNLERCGICHNYGPKEELHRCPLRDYSGKTFCKTCKEIDHGWCDALTVAPWVDRGIKIKTNGSEIDNSDKGTLYRQFWGFNPEDHRIVSDAADYYLLLAIRDKLYAPGGRIEEMLVLQHEAKIALRLLVERLDPVLINYCDMVIGGELRHHGAASEGGVSGARTTAWNVWKRLRQLGGEEVLLDAARLFLDYKPNQDTGEGPGYCGPSWAAIATTLHARLTNQITPEMWIDRVWNLQHNGGIVLNKVAWKPVEALEKMYAYTRWANDVAMITNYIGPIHGSEEPRMGELCVFASPAVQSLWGDYSRALRRELMRSREMMHPGLLPVHPLQFEDLKNTAGLVLEEDSDEPMYNSDGELIEEQDSKKVNQSLVSLHRYYETNPYQRQARAQQMTAALDEENAEKIANHRHRQRLAQAKAANAAALAAMKEKEESLATPAKKKTPVKKAAPKPPGMSYDKFLKQQITSNTNSYYAYTDAKGYYK